MLSITKIIVLVVDECIMSMEHWWNNDWGKPKYLKKNLPSATSGCDTKFFVSTEHGITSLKTVIFTQGKAYRILQDKI
jgi:hypothetical protein